MYPVLHRTGFASQPTAERRDDGLRLIDAYITAAVRCAPPDNKPTPEEISACAPFLVREISALKNLKVVVALGKIGPPAKEAVPRLADLLMDKDSEVRIASAEALGRIGPAAMPAAAKLREAIKDPLVAATARKAMDRIGIPDEGPKKK